MSSQYACFNGKIVPAKDLLFSFDDLAGDLGWARNWRVFDVLEARGTVPFHGEDHYNRLMNFAREASLPIEGVDYIERIPEFVEELLKKNGLPESVVRIDITGGTEDPHSYASSTHPNLFIQVSKAYSKDEIKELSFFTINHKREFPHIKTVNYYAACAAMQAAKLDGHHDILFVDKDRGNVFEPSRKNIFVVGKDGEIRTPKDDILKGVTRSIVIDLAREHYPVKEANVTLDDLENAAEVFVTSTTYFVAPVVRIAGSRDLRFEVGEKTLHLNKLFREYSDNYYKSRGAS